MMFQANITTSIFQGLPTVFMGTAPVCLTDWSQLVSPGLRSPSSPTHTPLLVTSLQREELNIICSVLSEVGIIRNYLSLIRFFAHLFIIHGYTGR